MKTMLNIMLLNIRPCISEIDIYYFQHISDIIQTFDTNTNGHHPHRTLVKSIALGFVVRNLTR